MQNTFAEKIVLITGSSRGIGAEMALAFAGQGANIVLHGRDRQALEHVQQQIQQLGVQSLVVTGDVSRRDELEVMRQQIQERFGGLDVLAVNAGGNPTPPGPFAQLSEEAWRAALDGNLTATFLTIQTFLPLLNVRERGSIMTMSSSAARRRSAQSPLAYAVAKAGIQALSQQLAAEPGPKLRVNCLAPGTIMTGQNQQRLPADTAAKLSEQHPLKRLGAPADVAQAAVFLASDQASWITGAVLDVNGGFIMAT